MSWSPFTDGRAVRLPNRPDGTQVVVGTLALVEELAGWRLTEASIHDEGQFLTLTFEKSPFGAAEQSPFDGLQPSPPPPPPPVVPPKRKWWRPWR